MKKALIVVVAVIAVLLVFPYLLPSNIKVERTTEINKSVDVVYGKVNNLKSWEEWDPWFAKDPDMNSEYTGAEEGVDAKRCWDSDNPDVGKGCLTILESEANASIKAQLDFDGQNPGSGSWKFSDNEGVTTVTWAMNINMGMNPIGRVLGLFMDRMIGPDFDKGLESLKQVCESIPDPKQYPIEIEYMKIPSQSIYSIKDSAVTFELGDKFAELFVEISTHVAITGAEVTGQPIAIWHKYDPSAKHIIEAAIPVAITGESEGRVQAGSIAEGNVVRAVHIGSYQSAAQSYEVLYEYIADNGYVKAGATWEQYMTDPVSQPDTSKWITHIYLPVK